MKKQKKRFHWLAVQLGLFAAAALGCLVWGRFFLKAGDELGYSLLTLYLILPVAALGCCWIAGVQPEKGKWCFPALYAALTLLVGWAVFGTLSGLPCALAFLCGLLGLLVGTALRPAGKAKRPGGSKRKPAPKKRS